MGKFSPQELGRTVNFADSSGALNPEARMKKRLAQSRVPSTANQTQSWVQWNDMAAILGQPFDTTRIPISKLEQMRRDSMLALGLSLCKVPLVRAPWYIKCSDARRASFVDGALRRIYGRFILAYTNSFDFGFSAIVKRFEYGVPDWTYINAEDVGSNDPSVEKDVWPDKGINALLWKPFMALSPRVAIPHWNAAEEFAGIDYSPGGAPDYYGWSGTSGFPWTNGSNGSGGTTGRAADIPLDWALWATNEKDSVFGSLWGYPRLGYAYRYWWSYWYKFGLSDRAFERFADPAYMMYYPVDNAVDEDGSPIDFGDVALSTLEQLRSGANVAVPGGVVRSDMDRATNTREWEALPMSANVNFEALNAQFEYLDVQKLRSVLVPEQAVIEGKGGTSSRNVAATMGDLFQESLSVVMEEIDDLINRYMIPQLLEANFGPGGPECQKVTTGFDPQDVETARLIVTGYANTDPSSMPVDIRELLKRLGIPTVGYAAFKKISDDAAKKAAESQPPVVTPKPGQAGTTKLGQYIQPQEVINLDQPVKEQTDEEFIEKHIGLFERMAGMFKREKDEPQDVRVTFDVQVEDSLDKTE